MISFSVIALHGKESVSVSVSKTETNQNVTEKKTNGGVGFCLNHPLPSTVRVHGLSGVRQTMNDYTKIVDLVNIFLVVKEKKLPGWSGPAAGEGEEN
jgi:hypothetical protein